MEKILLGPEPQDNFPHDDLTEENAMTLELWLQNRDLLEATHEQSEQLMLYMASHACVSHLARHIGKATAIEGLNLGAMTYEATSLLVRTQPDTHDAITVAHGAHSIVPADPCNAGLNLYVESRDEITQYCPNLTHVVTEVAARISPKITEAAIAGAGLMRRSELVAKSYLQN